MVKKKMYFETYSYCCRLSKYMSRVKVNWNQNEAKVVLICWRDKQLNVV